MKIAHNKVVGIEYKLYVIDDEIELVEETEEGEPFTFLFGAGEVIPGMETALEGKVEGDSFVIDLACADAFGEEQEDYYHEFPISEFLVDGELDEEMLEEEAVVPMEDEEGNVVYGVVIERKPDSVVIDFNHPLAGEDVRYEGKVVFVRDASEDELENGTI